MSLAVLIWTQGIVGLGYFLGNRADGEVNGYLLPVSWYGALVDLIPVVYEMYRERKFKRSESLQTKIR
jgi:membrane protein DedA with SNARE-associated domain